jgi:hypothetical protein
VTATAETTDWTRMEVFELLTMQVYERMCANYYQVDIDGRGGTY